MGGSHGPWLEWRRVDVEGCTASYGVGGNGPAVVFLHGWALAPRVYRAGLKRLMARGFRVYAPGVPGFAGTASFLDQPDDFGAYARWIESFLDAVGLDEPVVLMGHSFGGGICIRTARDFPTRVGGVVLVNSLGGNTWRTRGDVVHSMRERPLWHWGLHLATDVMPLHRLGRVLPFVLDAAVPNLLHQPRAFFHSAFMARHADFSRELAELKDRGLPVAVLWSRRDSLITRASFDALCTALGTPIVMTVPGGHSWMIAEPDRFGEVAANAVELVSDSNYVCRHAPLAR